MLNRELDIFCSHKVYKTVHPNFYKQEGNLRNWYNWNFVLNNKIRPDIRLEAALIESDSDDEDFMFIVSSESESDDEIVDDYESGDSEIDNYKSDNSESDITIPNRSYIDTPDNFTPAPSNSSETDYELDKFESDDETVSKPYNVTPASSESRILIDTSFKDFEPGKIVDSKENKFAPTVNSDVLKRIRTNDTGFTTPETSSVTDDKSFVSFDNETESSSIISDDLFTTPDNLSVINDDDNFKKEFYKLLKINENDTKEVEDLKKNFLKRGYTKTNYNFFKTRLYLFNENSKKIRERFEEDIEDLKELFGERVQLPKLDNMLKEDASEHDEFAEIKEKRLKLYNSNFMKNRLQRTISNKNNPIYKDGELKPPDQLKLIPLRRVFKYLRDVKLDELLLKANTKRDKDIVKGNDVKFEEKTINDITYFEGNNTLNLYNSRDEKVFESEWFAKQTFDTYTNLKDNKFYDKQLNLITNTNVKDYLENSEKFYKSVIMGGTSVEEEQKLYDLRQSLLDVEVALMNRERITKTDNNLNFEFFASPQFLPEKLDLLYIRKGTTSWIEKESIEPYLNKYPLFLVTDDPTEIIKYRRHIYAKRLQNDNNTLRLYYGNGDYGTFRILDYYKDRKTTLEIRFAQYVLIDGKIDFKIRYSKNWLNQVDYMFPNEISKYEFEYLFIELFFPNLATIKDDVKALETTIDMLNKWLIKNNYNTILNNKKKQFSQKPKVETKVKKVISGGFI